MRRLLVFQHVPHEILGIFHPLLKARGFRIRYVNFAREPAAQPKIEDYNGLVVLGGPMNVDQTDAYPHLAWEVVAISRAIDRGMPVLGICLGAQLIAKALGATVARSPATEIGWFEVTPMEAAAADPVLGALTSALPIFQWHEDAAQVPAGAVHLASSRACPNQAFRYGERVYGFQFHLEVDQPLIERWLNVPVHDEQMNDLRSTVDMHALRADTERHIAASRKLGDAVFGRFIDLFDLPIKRRMLRSR